MGVGSSYSLWECCIRSRVYFVTTELTSLFWNWLSRAEEFVLNIVRRYWIATQEKHKSYVLAVSISDLLFCLFRSCLGFEFPSLGIKSDYAFSDLANVFKNSILQSADYECDDLDSENAVCEDDCFVDSACSSEGFEDGSDLFWREDSKTICDQKCNTDECSIDNEPSVLNDNSSSPSSCSCESNSSFNDSGLASDCFRPSASNSGLQSANNGSVVNPGSACRENIRFPSDKRNSYLSKSLCRWSECADHISSTSKLLDHLQVRNTPLLCIFKSKALELSDFSFLVHANKCLLFRAAWSSSLISLNEIFFKLFAICIAQKGGTFY